MPLGDLFGISREGIPLSPAQLHMLDLRKKDVVWGQWVEGRGGREKMQLQSLDATEFNPRSQGPHLVLSTIHPDLWTSVLRLEARLTHNHRALDDLLFNLAKLGANILYVDTSNGGFDLQIVEIIFHIPSLDKTCRSILAEVPNQIVRDRGDAVLQETRLKSRLNAYREIGARVHSCAFVIESQLRLQDMINLESDDQAGFFHASTRLDGARPWYLDQDQVECVPILERQAREAGVLNDGVQLKSVLKRLTAKLTQLHANRCDDSWPIQFQGGLDPYLVDAHSGNVSQRAINHWRDYRRDPIKIHGLSTLAYARVWRAFLGIEDRTFPLNIKFKLRGNILAVNPREPKPERLLLGEVKSQYRTLTKCSDPLTEWLEDWPAFGTYNRIERFVRLRLIRPLFAEKYAWHAQVPYRLTTSYENTSDLQNIPQSGGSRGLAACITDKIAHSSTLDTSAAINGEASVSKNVVIEKITNRITKSELIQDKDNSKIHHVYEEGEIFIDMLAVSPSVVTDDFTDRVRAVIMEAHHVAQKMADPSVLEIDREEIRVHSLSDEFIFAPGDGDIQ